VRVVASIVGAAVLVVAATASPASSASPTCSQAAARAAIAQAKPRLALIGDKVLTTPEQADRVLCFDVTGDGRTDMAVSLASGGTAGDVGWLLFVPNDARWRLARSGTGYKLGLQRSGSKLEVVQPVYRAKDPNCCPSGGFDRTLYRWDGSRLVVARASHTKTFR
jgi:hypothetical protein